MCAKNVFCCFDLKSNIDRRNNVILTVQYHCRRNIQIKEDEKKKKIQMRVSPGNSQNLGSTKFTCSMKNFHQLKFTEILHNLIKFNLDSISSEKFRFFQGT